MNRALSNSMVVALVVVATSAWPCATASDGSQIALVGERVLIVWDTKTKTEHFVRCADFDVESERFGFVVPTPSVPELAEVEVSPFHHLALYIWQNSWHPSSWSSGGTGVARGGRGGQTVTVVQSQVIGDYTATTVRATSGSALNEWLGANGFKSRPALEAWCAHYARLKWVFTAFKYTSPNAMSGSTATLRLSFKTERPFYPFKAPTDDWPANSIKPMSVFFVSDHETSGVYRGTTVPWEAKQTWAGDLDNVVVGKLAEDICLKRESFPEYSYMTAFENSVNTSGYSRDLEFRPVPYLMFGQ